MAAVLHQNPLTHLDKLITYTSDDIRHRGIYRLPPQLG
ncbi:beta-lactamase [Mycobacterium tuberculosis]|nr:beta-lactamase [Mycobacterium tuberculosis]